MKRKLLSILLCGVLLCGILPILPTGAVDSDGIYTVDTVQAQTGDEVIVNINVSNNPGTAAMTISITYNSSALTFKAYTRGLLSDYTVAAHPDRNLIRLVNCEASNKYVNGLIISLVFKVNENAKADFYPITIDYKSGDFCKWDLTRLMPTIVPGGVEVAYNGSNCPHKSYGTKETVTPAQCTEAGLWQHACLLCGHTEVGGIPARGHDYQSNWTVDVPATATESGTMSRHCNHCDMVTDIINYSLEQVEENGIDNSKDSTVAPSELTGGPPDNSTSSKEEAPAKSNDITIVPESAEEPYEEKTAESLLKDIQADMQTQGEPEPVAESGSFWGQLVYRLFFEDGGGLFKKLFTVLADSVLQIFS